MPPRRHSRYTFADAVQDEDGAVVLYGEEPFRYRKIADTREHPVKDGDTLFTLAARYFRGFDRPAGLWWIIADFQPEPIHDPTIALQVGRTLVIPSVRAVEEEVFSEKRRRT